MFNIFNTYKTGFKFLHVPQKDNFIRIIEAKQGKILNQYPTMQQITSIKEICNNYYIQLEIKYSFLMNLTTQPYYKKIIHDLHLIEAFVLTINSLINYLKIQGGKLTSNPEILLEGSDALEKDLVHLNNQNVANNNTRYESADFVRPLVGFTYNELKNYLDFNIGLYNGTLVQIRTILPTINIIKSDDINTNFNIVQQYYNDLHIVLSRSAYFKYYPTKKQFDHVEKLYNIAFTNYVLHFKQNEAVSLNISEDLLNIFFNIKNYNMFDTNYYYNMYTEYINNLNINNVKNNDLFVYIYIAFMTILYKTNIDVINKLLDEIKSKLPLKVVYSIDNVLKEKEIIGYSKAQMIYYKKFCTFKLDYYLPIYEKMYNDISALKQKFILMNNETTRTFNNIFSINNASNNLIKNNMFRDITPVLPSVKTKTASAARVTVPLNRKSNSLPLVHENVLKPLEQDDAEIINAPNPLDLIKTPEQDIPSNIYEKNIIRLPPIVQNLNAPQNNNPNKKKKNKGKNQKNQKNNPQRGQQPRGQNRQGR